MQIEEERRVRRNCKLDLQIPSLNAETPSIGFCRQTVSWSTANQITISYADATELQAIAILWVARKESEEKYRKGWGSAAAFVQHQSGGLSLKKSLQKFLQKRKDRIQSSSMPY